MLSKRRDKGHPRRVRWTAYDTRSAVRAAIAAALGFALAWLVTASTDEGGITLMTRAGRALPLAPACAGLGTWLALARGRARGEALALEALGRSPWQRSAAAVFGASAIALAAALALLSQPQVDVQGFFPVAPRAVSYRFEGGAFVDDAAGVRIEPNGDLTPAACPTCPVTASLQPRPPARVGRVPAYGRLAAALAMALAGLAIPMMAARPARDRRGSPRPGWRAAGALAATVAASIVLFHASAAGRVAALSADLPAFVLLVATAFRYRGDAWTTTTRG